MATFVLVHGGWGGGWEWRAVADRLRERGHVALTPTLTGLGERSHLRSRSVTLETHADDVVGVIEWERLEEVFLVGHSYGGTVIRTAASRIPGLLKGLIYIDAFIPDHGQSTVDLLDPDWVETMILGPARTHGDGWLVPYPFADDPDGFPPEVAERYRSSPHPLRTFTDPAVVHDAISFVPTAFVHCIRKEPGEDAFLRSERIARERGWVVREIRSAHDVQIEDPEGIASILDDLATHL